MAERKRVVLAEPRGFCAGVRRAIAIVERALEVYGPPVYVRKEIVHNHYVVRGLESRGARFVDSEAEVPEGAVCVFSAHGVAPAVHRASADRGLEVIDATCPLVAKVHQEARRFARDERTILLIGHRDHEEVEGTYGEAPDRTVIVETVEDVAALDLPRDAPVALLSQTTLSLDDTAGIVDALRDRFDDLREPPGGDICYASQNRQNAVKALAGRSDLVLVVGSVNSSNSIRMVEVARDAGVRAHLVPDVGELEEGWLEGVASVGVSAGASAPEILVDQLLDRLAALGYDRVEFETTATENVVFNVPAGLAAAAPAGARPDPS
ncbi:4-hydroxy-3-methylbut-2-enyl diphosphate reductase [Actinomadura viridis]|uniref:4-hydroxy-3-methylbut-2-enyl diphosphate reductase n=1 Tax=Actinomadura viridis TaxID=58110 RepID=A0A931GGZ5_9ACTN|nr:4-hydroxy-3-methylbut-2-enyl diphosphate reductase [Actinomadura viridis]MBG6086868.1 4-hydroxy-3-methylbut-2-enyl diphosphate reductase [Actinomadura viridis]